MLWVTGYRLSLAAAAASAAAAALVVVVEAVILAFIWMKPSGDGELNQIFMAAKNGNIKLYMPPPSTCASTLCGR